ncbi:endonuclease III [Nitriliruptoria bacterium AS10]|nr:endonuclease III [Salsipaludibacter albus]
MTPPADEPDAPAGTADRGVEDGSPPPDGVGPLSGKTRRAPWILDRLAVEHPDAHIALDFTTPFELLVATMLSAQSTDVMVNQVTPDLFARFPDATAMAEATREELEELIGRLGLFRQKAKNLQATARQLLVEHDGEVPTTMEALTALPGVARKTANVVISNTAGEDAAHVGVVVDTHVRRLARRLRFTRQDTPPRIETDLMRLFPADRWLDVSDLLIFHGRRVCTARNRDCGACVVAPLCPSDATEGRTDKAQP